MGLTSKLEKLKFGDHDKSEAKQAPATNTNAPSDADTDDIDEMDNEGQSILMGIIAQLRPGMDLTKITLPTFILEKKSMLERITNFFQIPDLLLEANHTEEPVARFVNILKWYLASWHIAPKAVKKPLNPVLGETFLAIGKICHIVLVTLTTCLSKLLTILPNRLIFTWFRKRKLELMEQ